MKRLGSLSRAARAGLASVALVTVVALAGSAGWWVVAGSVREGARAWIEGERERGARIDLDELSVSGFPFAFRLAIDGIHVVARGLDWRGRLVAESAITDTARVTVILPGEQRVTLTSPGHPPIELVFPDGGRGQLTLSDHGAPRDLDLAFRDVKVSAAQPLLRVGELRLALSQPATPPTGHLDTGLTLTLDADQLALAEPPPRGLGTVPLGLGTVPLGLGPVIERATAAVRVQGPTPTLQPGSLARWRDDGGTMELDTLGLTWGPLKLHLAGTLALDRDLQPQGAMTAKLHGAKAVLGLAQDYLKPSEMRLARGVVAAMSRPTGADGEPVVTAPVTLQLRALFIGPLKVAAVPMIVW